MNLELHIIIIILSVLFELLVINLVRIGRIELKYTLLWIIAGFALLIVSIFPDIMTFAARLVNIYNPLNAAFFLSIIFLLIVTLNLTAIISGLKEKVYHLTQLTALLEKRINDLEGKTQNSIEK